MISVTAPPVYRLAEIAATAPDLDLDPNGVPRTTLYGVVLSSSASDSDVHAAAEVVRDSLAIAVGIADTDTAHDVAPDLLDALDLTLTNSAAQGRTTVQVADPAAALDALNHAVASSPRAAVVLTQLLRATAELEVRAGLAAEAAAYSTLLAGPEFAAWLASRGDSRASRGAPDPVQLERAGDHLTLTLNRPERRNAFDANLREALVDALTVAVAAPELMVTLRGAGPDFSSGGDLDEFGSALDVVSAYLVRLQRHPGWVIHQIRERVIAQLHGACIGAGVEIPAFAGRVVASPDTYVALPEVSMGLIPGAGGTVSLTRRIGRWRTAWLALTGARLDADAGVAWGLFDEIAAR